MDAIFVAAETFQPFKISLKVAFDRNTELKSETADTGDADSNQSRAEVLSGGINNNEQLNRSKGIVSLTIP